MSLTSDYKIPVDIPDLQFYQSDEKFELESGFSFSNGIIIGYHTYGQLNEQRDNVIWVCHALTANSRVDDWWAGLFGEEISWILRNILLYVQMCWVRVMELREPEALIRKQIFHMA